MPDARLSQATWERLRAFKREGVLERLPIAVAEIDPPTPAKPKPCMCNKMLAPVCGANNKTYSNACVAKCAGVSIKYPVKCSVITGGIQPPVTEPMIADGSNWHCNKIAMKPVSCKCGYEQVTQNGCPQIQCKQCGGSCAMRSAMHACLALSVSPTSVPYHTGGCVCPKISLPICGVDGNTYTNECSAKCKGVKKGADGPCKPVVLDGVKPPPKKTTPQIADGGYQLPCPPNMINPTACKCGLEVTIVKGCKKPQCKKCDDGGWFLSPCQASMSHRTN